MPADSPGPTPAPSQPASPQVEPYLAKDEDDSITDDSDLPVEAKLVNNKWVYGVRKPTQRGFTIRWYPEQHFLPLELETPHFASLRSAVAADDP
ncbi:hypothetical protein AB1Y20_013616 [Prymnesium parvum]|uniref:Uncharacterized protein n=1 Tax=Prymnesium parvum TaxID=97485 RepID=A0AB34IH54_PRYPA